MRVAICDDEKSFRKDLKEKIYTYSNKHRLEMVADEYACGEDLAASKTVYDIVFLDYKMRELDGLDTARNLRERNLNCRIIFLTNYPEVMQRSFEVDTFRFFSKPVDENELYRALDDYFRKFGNDYPILITSNRETVCIDTKDIIYLEADRKNCIIHLAKTSYRCAKTMAKVGELVPKPHFHKVHRAFIINLNYVQGYDSEKIRFKNSDIVYVGKTYHQSFRTDFKDYVKGRFA